MAGYIQPRFIIWVSIWQSGFFNNKKKTLWSSNPPDPIPYIMKKIFVYSGCHYWCNVPGGVWMLETSAMLYTGKSYDNTGHRSIIMIPYILSKMFIIGTSQLIHEGWDMGYRLWFWCICYPQTKQHGYNQSSVNITAHCPLSGQKMSP